MSTMDNFSTFTTSASATRPVDSAGKGPNSCSALLITETAGSAARVKFYRSALAKPGACVGADGAVGLCTVGNHTVKVTYVTAQGETEAGTASATISSAGTVKINLTSIPTLTGAGSELVIGRNIYMNEASGATWYKVDSGAAVATGPLADPVGTLARAEALAGVLNSTTPPSGGGLSFTTLRAAYTDAVANYRPGQPNSVLLITQGPHTDESLDAAGLDRKMLAQRGAQAVMKMIVEDGFFHADPHPGNVFYLPGNRLAFIDFGMVGRLSPRRREELQVERRARPR